MSEKLNIYEFSKRTTDTTYPYMVIVSPNATVPLIIRDIESGDIPLVVTINGNRKVVTRMSGSAYNVDKLIRTCGALELHKSEQEVKLINSVVEYMEEFSWTY